MRSISLVPHFSRVFHVRNGDFFSTTSLQRDGRS